MSWLGFIQCCMTRDEQKKERDSIKRYDEYKKSGSSKNFFEDPIIESRSDNDNSSKDKSKSSKAKKKSKKKGAGPKLPSIMQLHNQNLGSGITPGGPAYEEPESFDHEYYKFSMKIIDLWLNGKDQKVSEMSLDKEVQLEKVFYEEPIEQPEEEQAKLHQLDLQASAKKKDEEKRRFYQCFRKGNDSEQLYLVSSLWVRAWVDYIKNPESTIPGPVINDMIYQQHSNKQSLFLGKDLVLVSQKLWDIYFDQYGGGPVLKWKIDEISSQSPPDQQSMRPSQIDPETIQPLNDESSSYKKDSSEQVKDNVKKPQQKQNDLKQVNGIKIIDQRQGLDLSDFAVKPNQKDQQNKEKKEETKLYRPSSIVETKGKPTKNDEDYSPSKSRLRIFGLENSRFYCYFNAVLQCIFSISEFRQFYEHSKYKSIKVKQPIQKGLKFSTALESFAFQIDKASKNSSNRVLKTVQLRSMIKEDFSPVLEHDSHEFLHYFFNNLKDELTEKEARFPLNAKSSVSEIWNSYCSQYPSIVDQLFTVIERTEVSCKNCKNTVHSLQYYLTFPLLVEKMKTIQQSLEHYAEKEIPQEYKCDKCKKNNSSEVQRKLLKVPEYLIIQLQRFSSYPTMRKIRGQIKYQEYLDISKFIVKESRDYDFNQPLYELQSLAVHMGSLNGGHYVAYSKKENEQWYCMNDERVGRVSLEEVLQQDAYLLFYKRSQNK